MPMRAPPGFWRSSNRSGSGAGWCSRWAAGAGLLTRHLIDAGHRVIATDASPAMIDLAREYAGGAEDFRVLVLPDDPLPPADAVVSVGHVVSYLDDEAAIERALVAIVAAVRPGGLFAIDICDLEWGGAARTLPTTAAPKTTGPS